MKTHSLNVSYLVVGLAFLGIAASWVLHETGVIGSADVEWLLPLTLVIAGGIGLIAFAARGMSGRRTTDPTADAGYDQPYDQPYDSEGDLR
jgi:hypothetical protein